MAWKVPAVVAYTVNYVVMSSNKLISNFLDKSTIVYNNGPTPVPTPYPSSPPESAGTSTAAPAPLPSSALGPTGAPRSHLPSVIVGPATHIQYTRIVEFEVNFEHQNTTGAVNIALGDMPQCGGSTSSKLIAAYVETVGEETMSYVEQVCVTSLTKQTRRAGSYTLSSVVRVADELTATIVKSLVTKSTATAGAGGFQEKFNRQLLAAGLTMKVKALTCSSPKVQEIGGKKEGKEGDGQAVMLAVIAFLLSAILLSLTVLGYSWYAKICCFQEKVVLVEIPVITHLGVVPGIAVDPQEYGVVSGVPVSRPPAYGEAAACQLHPEANMEASAVESSSCDDNVIELNKE